MSADRDGGPAFPVPNLEHDADFNGMTLRDYFAAKAIPVAMTASWRDVGYTPTDGLTEMQQHARLAYQMADAMIAERSKA